MSLFDAYVMVDWSAANTPKRGKDSIWYAVLLREGRGLRQRDLANPPTRAEARAALAEILARLAASGRRVLAGFDFPNAYPRGFAAAAGFRAPHKPDWRAVWDGLAGMIEDAPDNRSNRFLVAAELNRRLSGANSPFWGHPHQHRYDNLSPRPTGTPEELDLPTRRLCERHVPQTKTCWQLAYNGSVGSQALLGIPVQRALRDDAALAPFTRVWPFETGLAAPSSDIRVVLAEVYPSLVPVSPGPGEVKDALQVATIARTLARRDNEGLLAGDLSGPAALTPGERRIVEREEGWLLGAGTFGEKRR